ncbi:MAG: ribosome recycling factor [Prevotella sp.]|nr:ribosome recycling factor [Prevotella sp.]
MNNYISFETIDFAKKLKGYNMLFNYRMSNLCVKAEPTALMPVTVFVAGTEYNLEEVANILKPDDFSFDVYPKNQNNLQDIISGIFDVHPEFKMELKTDKAENEGGADTQHVFYTMPPVDKDRRKLLNETTKTFHKECKVNLDVTYADLQARLVEPYTQMSPQDVDEARKGFKKVYDDARDECDKMLQLKLNEIEEGYQRYLTEYNDRYAEPETDDHEMEVSEDPEIDALFK